MELPSTSMPQPIWLDEDGRRRPTRSCFVPECDREWPEHRYRFEHLCMIGWAKPRQVLPIVNWCGHSWKGSTIHTCSNFKV
jgi:hypothetical protein